MIQSLNVENTLHRQLIAKSTGELLSKSASFGKKLGLENLEIHHEILQPGHKLHSKHSHSQQEEMIYLLEGELDIWLENEKITLNPGEVIGLPADQIHSAHNNTNLVCKLLKITTAIASDIVTFH